VGKRKLEIIIKAECPVWAGKAGASVVPCDLKIDPGLGCVAHEIRSGKGASKLAPPAPGTWGCGSGPVLVAGIVVVAGSIG